MRCGICPAPSPSPTNTWTSPTRLRRLAASSSRSPSACRFGGTEFVGFRVTPSHLPRDPCLPPRRLAPDVVRGVDDELEFGDLFVVGEGVSLDGRREPALRRQADPVSYTHLRA